MLAVPGVLTGCPPPEPITVAGNRKFRHPGSERELVLLVDEARARKVQLRVRGSLHSHEHAIFTDAGDEHINVQLDRYNRVVVWDDAKLQVTVQSGMHLGVDPLDPGSNDGNSLLRAMNDRGWALPDLGGITHQTVGGFLSTGSMGGSTHFDFAESIACIRLVAGDGKVYELRANPSDPADAETNPFFGAAVAMGLYGIVSTVTFQCVPRFDIIGKQMTRTYARSPVDLFGGRDGGLRKWMDDNQYNRLLLWPQKNVKKVQLWSARRTVPADAARTHKAGKFAAKPFQQVPELLQSVAHAIYEHTDRTPPPYPKGTVDGMTAAINTFITEGDEEFWDAWFTGLPMDNKVSDRFLPTEFTELFVDIGKTEAAMKTLNDFWEQDDRMGRTGPNATEVYPARASKFWMSPSYGRDSFRIDVFWFKSGATDPDAVFYPQYFHLLSQFDFRFHWGKHLSLPNSTTGPAYRRRVSPAWDSFMKWRQWFDKDQIFVTKYWRDHLGIQKA